MRIVLDANQAGKLARLACAHKRIFRHATLVLTREICAEIALGPDAPGRLQALSALTVRFGVEPPSALRQVAAGTDAQAATYDPVYPRRCATHRLLRRTLKGDATSLLTSASGWKARNREVMRETVERIRSATKRVRDARSRGESPRVIENLSNVDDAMTMSNFLQRYVPYLLGSGGSGTANQVDEEAASERLMTNPYTRRYLRFMVGLYVGYGSGWADNVVNVPACAQRDDFPDMQLPLYAKQADIILTADKKFRRLYESIDRARTVRVLTCDECVELIKRSR